MYLLYNCNVSRLSLLHLQSDVLSIYMRLVYIEIEATSVPCILTRYISEQQDQPSLSVLSTQNSTALRTAEITFLQDGESYSPLYLTFSMKNSIISFRYKTHCSAMLDVLCQLHSSSRSFECFNFGTVPTLLSFPFYGLAL